MEKKLTMTVDEALNITANVFAGTNGNLRDHQAMQLALEILTKAAKPESKVPPKRKTDKDK